MTDGVVTLRRFSNEDAAAVFEACQDREISRWTATIPWPYPKEAATSWIESHEALCSSGLHAPFAAVDAQDGRFLGSMSVNRKPEETNAVAGYWIAKPARGRGVATRALRIALHWTRSHWNVQEVALRTMVGNVASERVAEKNGFRLIGEEADYIPSAVTDTAFHVKHWRLDLGGA